MSDPRHRRPKRRRGLTLFSGSGRRRSSGVVEESPSTPRELHRAARRVTSRSATRKVVLAALGAAAIVAAAVVASLVVLTAQSGDETAPPPADASGGVSALVVVTDDEGQAASVALFGSDPSLASEAVLFPPALLTTIPGFGEGELAATPRFGGAELTALSLMNLLGLRVDASVDVGAEAFGQAIGVPLTVDLPNPLIVSEGSSEVVAVGEGSAERSSEQLALLLTEQGVSDQLAWLVRQGAVWESVLDRMAAEPDIVSRLVSRGTGDLDGTGAALMAAAGDPDRQVVAAPVSPVERPGGDVELYDLSSQAVAALGENQFPYLRLGPTPRPRIEVLNGNGEIGTTQLVAETLIRRGFWVVRTDNADAFTYPTTRIIAQGRANQQVALDLRSLLTVGDVEVEQRQPSGVVDVTIIVGGDLPSGSSEAP